MPLTIPGTELKTRSDRLKAGQFVVHHHGIIGDTGRMKLQKTKVFHTLQCFVGIAMIQALVPGGQPAPTEV